MSSIQSLSDYIPFLGWLIISTPRAGAGASNLIDEHLKYGTTSSVKVNCKFYSLQRRIQCSAKWRIFVFKVKLYPRPLKNHLKCKTQPLINCFKRTYSSWPTLSLPHHIRPSTLWLSKIVLILRALRARNCLREARRGKLTHQVARNLLFKYTIYDIRKLKIALYAHQNQLLKKHRTMFNCAIRTILIYDIVWHSSARAAPRFAPARPSMLGGPSVIRTSLILLTLP